MDPHAAVRRPVGISRQHDPRVPERRGPQPRLDVMPQTLGLTGEIERRKLGPIVGRKHLER